MWRLADRQLDEFVGRRRVRVRQRVRRARSRCSSSPTCSACPKPTTRCSAPRWVPGAPGRRVGSTGDDGSAQPVGVPLRAVHRLRRRPAPRAARRRAHRTRDRDVPRRRRRPRSSTSCASPPTCSRPGRRRPCACSATALQMLGEQPELQQLLRDERDRIPNFVEESLRFESPVKGDFRLSRVPTTVGGVDIPAGTTVMVLNGAANRDPRRFEQPDEFRRRPRQRPPAHRVRPRHPHLPRRAARPRRGPRQHRAHPRPHARHPDLRSRARAARRPPLPVRADVHPARPASACTSSSPS